jgi:hypothetical protein
MRSINRWLVLLGLGLLSCAPAHAGYNRLSLGVGIIQFQNPSQTYLEAGAEYENRFDAIFGIGALGNYIFANPWIAFLGAPELFVHPLAGDWFVSASPLIELGGGMASNLGMRLGTRIPLPMGVFTLVPSLALDFINGGHDAIFGLGIQF